MENGQRVAVTNPDHLVDEGVAAKTNEGKQKLLQHFSYAGNRAGYGQRRAHQALFLVAHAQRLQLRLAVSADYPAAF